MTYPNVLLMGYLEETRQLTPEWRMKLEQAISQGYQRILTFEVEGGGFDWYGKAPADTRLTAYGVLELTDMSRVYPVDPAVIDRAVALLQKRRSPNGSWDNLTLTAYVAWALRVSGRPDTKAEAWLRTQQPQDSYTQALIANALGDPAVLSRPLGAARETLYHSGGRAAEVETTALATLVTRSEEGLAFLAKSKDPSGGWQSTQATILALKALLEVGKCPPPKAPVRITLRVNGREISGFQTVDASNFDVMQEVEIPLREGENTVEVTADGELSATVQVAGRYYLPWDRVPKVESPLDLEVRYRRAELERNESTEAEVRLTYRGQGTFMVIVDLGIPPGFDVDPASFEKLGFIDKFTIAGRQVTLYFGRLQPGQVHQFRYTLHPRFPVRATTPPSWCYEYYTPDRRGTASPTRLIVK